MTKQHARVGTLLLSLKIVIASQENMELSDSIAAVEVNIRCKTTRSNLREVG
jgi:hypothetical protein